MAKITIQCSQEAVRRIGMLLMNESVTRLEIDYDDETARSYFPKPKKITAKKPLLRDRVMAEFESKQQKTGQPHVKVSASSIVREALMTGQVRTLAVLRALCDKAGYAKNAASVALDTMLKVGEVERVEAGIYRLKALAVEHEPALRLEAPSQVNGRGVNQHA